MSKDLLNFLFSESFEPEGVAEATARIFSRLAEVEDIEDKTGPLDKVLRKCGRKGPICINDDGSAQICFDTVDEYSDMKSKLLTGENLLELAELGWVPDFRGDDSTGPEDPHMVVCFIPITSPTSITKKEQDIDKVMAQHLKDLEADAPEGIGSDEKIPKLPTPPKRTKITAPKPVKNSINHGGKKKK